MIWIIVILLACTVGLMLIGGILYFAWELLCCIFSYIMGLFFPDDW